MWQSIKEYIPLSLGRWLGMTIGAIGAIGTIAQVIGYTLPNMPLWAWLIVMFLGFSIAQFLAFHKVRVERDQLRVDSAATKEVISRLFVIKYGDDYSFNMPGASGFPDSPTGEMLMLRLLVEFTAIPDMFVESVNLEVMGKRMSSNWEPAGIGKDYYSQYVYFGIPDWVNAGQHTVKLFAFADGKEWSSDEFSVWFP